jgi:microcompartment protein CcmK/EutM
MILARVIGKAVSVVKHPAYERRRLLVVQPMSLALRPRGKALLAVDYVGAGEGDLVIVGAGPGVAREVFGVDRAPIRELVMAIVDSVSLNGAGVSVRTAPAESSAQTPPTGTAPT